MKSTGVKILLSASAFFMGMGMEGPNANVKPFTDEDRGFLEESFDAFRHYWVVEGVGELATKLVLVYEEAAGAFYNSAADEVTMTEGWVEFVDASTKSDFHKVAALEYVIAHEVAHGVQNEQHLLDNLDPATGNNLRAEFQADCLAGRTMQELYPQHVEAAMLFIGSSLTPHPTQHGSSSERISNFKNGASGDECSF